MQVRYFLNIKSTKISEVDLSVFIYRLFHKDFSSIVRTNTEILEWPKSVGKMSLTTLFRQCSFIAFVFISQQLGTREKHVHRNFQHVQVRCWWTWKSMCIVRQKSVGMMMSSAMKGVHSTCLLLNSQHHTSHGAGVAIRKLTDHMTLMHGHTQSSSLPVFTREESGATKPGNIIFTHIHFFFIHTVRRYKKEHRTVTLKLADSSLQRWSSQYSTNINYKNNMCASKRWTNLN